MDRIGFIGLGRMGRPMATNIVRRGFAVTVFDINAEATRALADVGAQVAGTIGELVAASDVIVTMLPSGAEVEQVVAGPGGVLGAGRPGQVVIDMSTVEPAVTLRVAEALSAAGLSLVDAPVGRLAIHADRGESLFMVGASEQDLARVRPVLDAMGTTILHCGPVSAGIKTKLVNNYIVVTLCQMNAEALTLAQKFGLDLETTLDVLNSTTATNGQLKVNWTNKVLAGDIAAGFTIDLAHKDMSLVTAAAQTERVAMPLAAITREMFNMARAGGYAQADFSGILDFNCDLAGAAKPRLTAAS